MVTGRKIKLDLDLTVDMKINPKWTTDIKSKDRRLLGGKTNGENLQVWG